MAQIESIDDVMSKKGSIQYLWEVIDPDNKYSYGPCLDAWYRMDLTAQRRLYLYLLYRKWRGEGFYGTPYEIITNCHPYPTNWDGRKMVDTLIKEGKIVSARFNGSFGLYTRDEARVWQMTDITPRR